jgi:hypothetical protein
VARWDRSQRSNTPGLRHFKLSFSFLFLAAGKRLVVGLMQKFQHPQQHRPPAARCTNCPTCLALTWHHLYLTLFISWKSQEPPLFPWPHLLCNKSFQKSSIGILLSFVTKTPTHCISYSSTSDWTLFRRISLKFVTNINTVHWGLDLNLIRVLAFFFFLYCCAGWEYIVVFMQVLTMYQI